MIIFGFQGIGKSTLACVENGCIDLESSNFHSADSVNDKWYECYGNVAIDLSKQGYIVFVSSHEVVRDYIKSKYENTVSVFPSLELKDEWIKKLQNRYDNSLSEKNYKALMNAKFNYENNINNMKSKSGFYYEIKSIDYDLADIVEKLKVFMYVGKDSNK